MITVGSGSSRFTVLQKDRSHELFRRTLVFPGAAESLTRVFVKNVIFSKT